MYLFSKTLVCPIIKKHKTNTLKTVYMTYKISLTAKPELLALKIHEYITLPYMEPDTQSAMLQRLRQRGLSQLWKTQALNAVCKPCCGNLCTYLALSKCFLSWKAGIFASCRRPHPGRCLSKIIRQIRLKMSCFQHLYLQYIKKKKIGNNHKKGSNANSKKEQMTKNKLKAVLHVHIHMLLAYSLALADWQLNGWTESVVKHRVQSDAVW